MRFSSAQIKAENLAAIGLDGYWYLGSPYSKYPDGPEAAWWGVCQLSADLVAHRVPHFCPIAWSHSVKTAGDLPIAIDDYDLWLPLDQPLMFHAYGLIVAKMRSWETSFGLLHEIRTFKNAGKPIIYLEVIE